MLAREIASRDLGDFGFSTCVPGEGRLIMAGKMINKPLDTVKTRPYNGHMQKKQSDSVPVNLRVPEKDYDRWREAATAEQRTITSLIRRAVDVYLRDMDARGEFSGKEPTE